MRMTVGGQPDARQKHSGMTAEHLAPCQDYSVHFLLNGSAPAGDCGNNLTNSPFHFETTISLILIPV